MPDPIFTVTVANDFPTLVLPRRLSFAPWHGTVNERPLSLLCIDKSVHSLSTWTLDFPVIQWFIIRSVTHYFGAQNVPDLANGSAFKLASVSLHKLTFTVSPLGID